MILRLYLDSDLGDCKHQAINSTRTRNFRFRAKSDESVLKTNFNFSFYKVKLRLLAFICFSHLARTQGAGAAPYVLMAKIQLAKKTVAQAHAKRAGQQTASDRVLAIDSSTALRLQPLNGPRRR